MIHFHACIIANMVKQVVDFSFYFINPQNINPRGCLNSPWGWGWLLSVGAGMGNIYETPPGGPQVPT